MRYIDCLKLQIYIAAWMSSAMIIIYGIIRYLGSIQPICISIGMIAQVLSFMIFGSIGVWWADRNNQNKDK